MQTEEHREVFNAVEDVSEKKEASLVGSANIPISFDWKKWRYRQEFVAARVIANLIRQLPYDALEPLSLWFGDAAFAVDHRGRATAMENLRIAFGERYGFDEREQITLESYRNFARTMLCLFWSPNLSLPGAPSVFQVEGLDSDPIHSEQGRAGIYFCPHYSNFEWLSHASALFIEKGIIIAQQFKNPLLGPIFNNMRSVTGHEIIPQERAIVRMLKRLKAGGKFGVLTDLSLDPRHGAVPIRCFGRWVSASPLPSVLFLRTAASLIPCECRPAQDGGFRMIYFAPLDLPRDATPMQITQACWDVFEPSIRERPELWLWAYKQWRFRPSCAAAEDYPAYANPSKRFDRLLKQHDVTPDAMSSIF